MTSVPEEFDIYEDIMFPVIRASFVCADGVDVLSSFPIIGEEIINVSFSLPGYDIIINENRNSLRDVSENDEEYSELLHGAKILIEQHDDIQTLTKDKLKMQKDSNNYVENEGEVESDIASTTSRGKNNSTGGEETDYDEDTFAEIIDDTEMEQGDTYEKIRIIEVSELERKYPLQKGDIINYKIEKIPPLLRDKERARIIKQVNIISLLNNTPNPKGLSFLHNLYSSLISGTCCIELFKYKLRYIL